MEARQISVLVVDDHPMLRERLRDAFSSDERLRYAGEASTGKEALQKALELRPDVVVLDIFLPDLNGDEVLRIMRQMGLEIEALILTASRVGDLYEVCEQGPDTLLFRLASSAEICSEIVGMACGDEHAAGPQTSRLETAASLTHVRLTTREQTVLALSAEGYKVQEIARHLSLSKTVINTQLQGIRAKLEARTTASAVAKAYMAGLLKTNFG